MPGAAWPSGHQVNLSLLVSVDDAVGRRTFKVKQWLRCRSARGSNAGFRPFCVLMDSVGALSPQGLIPLADSTQSKLALVEPTFLLLFD
jgi:hypothetical protein